MLCTFGLIQTSYSSCPFCLDRAFAEAASRRQVQKERKKSRAKYAAHPHSGPPPHLTRAIAPAENSVCKGIINALSIGRLAVAPAFLPAFG